MRSGRHGFGECSERNFSARPRAEAAIAAAFSRTAKTSLLRWNCWLGSTLSSPRPHGPGLCDLTARNQKRPESLEPILSSKLWSGARDLNPGPHGPEL